MAQVGFYHLTRTPLQQALPRLLDRSLQSGERVVILCPSDGAVADIDKALWEAPEPDWLPHGTEADGDPDLQPIWIAANDSAPNGAKFLFLVQGASSDRLASFQRVFDLFDGNDPEAVAAARTRWTAAKSAGHDLTYWRQGPRGWEK